ncbi:MAG TPA: hypothetical protein VHY76_14000 [Acetobacteraceae bacterium]|nr:hypothetical protein [Acetobacteraceae bacterium]
MTRRPHALAGAVLAALALAGCSGPDAAAPSYAAAAPGSPAAGGPAGQPSPAAIAACRQRADEIYLRQNRALLSERSTRDTPYASSGLPSNPTAGLSAMFGRDQDFADCLRSFGPAAPTGAGPVAGSGSRSGSGAATGAAPGAGAGTSPAMDQTVSGPTGVQSPQ